MHCNGRNSCKHPDFDARSAKFKTASRDHSGLFRSGSIRPNAKSGEIAFQRFGDRAVALIAERNVGRVGFSPEDFSGHSLCAGLATSAVERGQHERDIMQQTRHKSVKMLRRYIRKGSHFQGNVFDALGF